MEVDVIREFGIIGSGAMLLFIIFKKSMEETLKQNNDMMNHLMETNKQLRDTNRNLHESNVEIINKFGNIIDEHTKAILGLKDEIMRLDGKK